jgi:hypothetical protein
MTPAGTNRIIFGAACKHQWFVTPRNSGAMCHACVAMFAATTHAHGGRGHGTQGRKQFRDRPAARRATTLCKCWHHRRSNLFAPAPQGRNNVARGVSPGNSGRETLDQPRSGRQRCRPCGADEDILDGFAVQGLTPLATRFRPSGAGHHRQLPLSCQHSHNVGEHGILPVSGFAANDALRPRRFATFSVGTKLSNSLVRCFVHMPGQPLLGEHVAATCAAPWCHSNPWAAGR